jgi:hypothetical protein
VLDHFHFRLGPHSHIEIRSRNPQCAPGNLTEQTLQDGQGRSGTYGTIGSGEHIGEIVSLRSDSHRQLSLLLLLMMFTESY